MARKVDFRSLRSGIVRRRSFWDIEATRLMSIFGAPLVFLLNFMKRSLKMEVSDGMMCSQNILFQGHTETEQLTKIFETLGSPTLEEWKRFNWCEAWRTFPNFKKIKLDEKLKQMPKDAIALLERMLSYDPLKRPSAEDCLRDPYFADIFQETDLDLSHFRINDRNGAMRTATPSPSPSQTTPITTNRGGVFNGVFGSRTNIA